MTEQTRYTIRVALIVALGGFLMGFDASVISGVVGFIETEFELTKIQLGWSVASLTLTATIAMMLAGPVSDRVGRRPVLLDPGRTTAGVDPRRGAVHVRDDRAPRSRHRRRGMCG